jgi:hypothetical protein
LNLLAGQVGCRTDIFCEGVGQVAKAECWAAGGGNEGGGLKKKDKKGGEDKDKKSGKKAEVTTAEDSQQNIEAWAAIESDEGLPAMAAQESNSRKIFDSEASRHMSPFRTSFVTYRSIKFASKLARSLQPTKTSSMPSASEIL